MQKQKELENESNVKQQPSGLSTRKDEVSFGERESISGESSRDWGTPRYPRIN